MNRSFGPYQLRESLRTLEPYMSCYVAALGEQARVVELRVLNEALKGSETQAAFQRLQVLAEVRHPCLARIADSGVEDGFAYYSTDVVEAVSLREWASRKGGGLEPEYALDLLRPIAEALRALQEAGFLHRDLSLDTIRVDPASERAFLSTLSFRHALGIKRKPGYRSTVSTAAFSPELGDPRREDPRTDVFQFCGVLYQVLTGRDLPTVLDAAGRPDLVAKVPGPASRRNLAVPPELDDILARGLDPDPEKRFSTIGGVLGALEPVVQALQEMAMSGPATRAINVAALRKKREQIEERRQAARDRRRGGDRRQGGFLAWFQGLSLASKLAAFVVMVGLSASAPILVNDPPPIFQAMYQSARRGVSDRSVDVERLAETLLSEAADLSGIPTKPETFDRRLRALRRMAKALGPQVRETIASRNDLANLRIAYARDPRKGCKMLDDMIKACAEYLDKNPPKNPEPAS